MREKTESRLRELAQRSDVAKPRYYTTYSQSCHFCTNKKNMSGNLQTENFSGENKVVWKVPYAVCDDDVVDDDPILALLFVNLFSVSSPSL